MLEKVSDQSQKNFPQQHAMGTVPLFGFGSAAIRLRLILIAASPTLTSYIGPVMRAVMSQRHSGYSVMSDHAAHEIRRHYLALADRDELGDFCAYGTEWPYAEFGATEASDFLVYTTKPRLIAHYLNSLLETGRARIVGRYGLPGSDDLVRLKQAFGQRQLIFLGDADPSDLLVFALLFVSMPIRYCGLSDSLIHGLGVAITEGMTLKLSGVERSSLSIVNEYLPNLERMLGLECFTLLKAGRKLELEAAFNFRTKASTDWIAT